MATKLGMVYYECSTFEEYGVNDVFNNIVRLALSYKRDHSPFSVINGKFKHVLKPRAQPPLVLPVPTCPTFVSSGKPLKEDFSKLLESLNYCDVVFALKDGKHFYTHKVCLVIADHIFQKCFVPDEKEKGSPHRAKDVCEQSKLKILRESPRSGPLANTPGPKLVTVVEVLADVSHEAFKLMLLYFYSGRCPVNASSPQPVLEMMMKAADAFGVPLLQEMLQNVLIGKEERNEELHKQFVNLRTKRVGNLLLERQLYSGESFIYMLCHYFL